MSVYMCLSWFYLEIIRLDLSYLLLLSIIFLPIMIIFVLFHISCRKFMEFTLGQTKILCAKYFAKILRTQKTVSKWYFVLLYQSQRSSQVVALYMNSCLDSMPSTHRIFRTVAQQVLLLPVCAEPSTYSPEERL